MGYLHRSSEPSSFIHLPLPLSLSLSLSSHAHSLFLPHHSPSQRWDWQSQAVTLRTWCWTRVPLVQRKGTVRMEVAVAAQHTHWCSTLFLSRENIDLLRHFPSQ
uniref:Uncharacterized protein n=1 Tax=Anguilla anguilla TaxID=7936 RepID=A0A0E9WN33_ANGAN